MYTEVVDEKTFVIKGESFEVDEAIELSEEEQGVLASIQELAKERHDLQQSLINQCHMAEKNLIPELREPAHKIHKVSLQLSYLLNLLLHDVQTRLGGRLPLDYEDDYKGIKVRAKTPQDNLNFTLTTVKQDIGFTQFEAVRAIALGVCGNVKEKIKFDLSMNKKHGIQPVEVEADFDFDGFIEALSRYLKEKPAIQGFIMLLDVEIDEADPKKRIHYLITTDARRPDRLQKILEFGKAAKPRLIYIVDRDPKAQKGVRTLVGWSDGEKKGTTKIFVEVSPRSVDIEETTEKLEVPNGEAYEQILK